jgi:hypothetical protein
MRDVVAAIGTISNENWKCSFIEQSSAAVRSVCWCMRRWLSVIPLRSSHQYHHRLHQPHCPLFNFERQVTDTDR